MEFTSRLRVRGILLFGSIGTAILAVYGVSCEVLLKRRMSRVKPCTLPTDSPDKTKRGFAVTETKHIARHLLPMVMEELKPGAAGEPVTLTEAVSRAALKATAQFAAQKLRSIKAICSKAGLGRERRVGGGTEVAGQVPAAALETGACDDSQAVAASALGSV
jgi:hypothetical protein